MRTTQVCQVELYISLYDNCAMVASPQCNKLLYYIATIIHHMSHSFLYDICAMVAPPQYVTSYIAASCPILQHVMLYLSRLY